MSSASIGVDFLSSSAPQEDFFLSEQPFHSFTLRVVSASLLKLVEAVVSSTSCCTCSTRYRQMLFLQKHSSNRWVFPMSASPVKSRLVGWDYLLTGKCSISLAQWNTAAHAMRLSRPRSYVSEEFATRFTYDPLPHSYGHRHGASAVFQGCLVRQTLLTFFKNLGSYVLVSWCRNLIARYLNGSI